MSLKLYRVKSESPTGYDELAEVIVWAADPEDALAVVEEALDGWSNEGHSLPGGWGHWAGPYVAIEVEAVRGPLLAHSVFG